MNTSSSVSYTHLDVYKRQDTGIVEEYIFRCGMAVDGFGGKYSLSFGFVQRDEFAIEDVYKRQARGICR